MKILTKTKLQEMLQREYLVSNYLQIVTSDRASNAFIIVYPYYMVRVQYFMDCGWNFFVYGECSYMQSKLFIRIIDRLESDAYITSQAKKEKDKVL